MTINEPEHEEACECFECEDKASPTKCDLHGTIVCDEKDLGKVLNLLKGKIV